MSTILERMAFFFLLNIQFALSADRDDGDVIDTFTGVRISFTVESDAFPDAWKREPTGTEMTSLAPDRRILSVNTVRAALRKYPPLLTEKTLSSIYLVQTMYFNDIVGDGVSYKSSMFLRTGEISIDAVDIEGRFHYQMARMLLRNNRKYFNNAEWQALNPPSFHYSHLSDLGSDQAPSVLRKTRTDDLFNHGFLSTESLQSVDADFAAFAELLMLNRPELWSLASRNPTIARKLAVVIAFYRSLSPTFTEDYFRQNEGKTAVDAGTKAVENK